VTPDTLRAAKLLRKAKNPVVLLGRGEVKAALKVSVHRATASAKSKIEKAGGSVTLLAMPEAAAPVAEAKPAKKAPAKKASKK
jgi:large subunit ribosomal protein L15